MYKFLLLLLPLYSTAQSKGDKKIIITVADTANILNRVSLVFYESGYTFEQKDEAVKFLMTSPKELKSFSVKYKIKALIKGNQVILSGLHNLSTLNPDYNLEIDYTKPGKTIPGQAWQALKDIADKLEGKITYSK